MWLQLAGILDAGVDATVICLNAVDDQRTSANLHATFEMNINRTTCRDDRNSSGVQPWLIIPLHLQHFAASAPDVHRFTDECRFEMNLFDYISKHPTKSNT